MKLELSLAKKRKKVGEKLLKLKKKDLFLLIFLLVMPKYEGGISSSGVSPKWVKSRRRRKKKEEEKKKMASFASFRHHERFSTLIKTKYSSM